MRRIVRSHVVWLFFKEAIAVNLWIMLKGTQVTSPGGENMDEKE